MKWLAFCEEHNREIQADGSCAQCRDSAGRPFVLDMQSIYLVPASPAIRAWRWLRDRVLWVRWFNWQ